MKKKKKYKSEQSHYNVKQELRCNVDAKQAQYKATYVMKNRKFLKADK